MRDGGALGGLVDTGPEALRGDNNKLPWIQPEGCPRTSCPAGSRRKRNLVEPVLSDQCLESGQSYQRTTMAVSGRVPKPSEVGGLTGLAAVELAPSLLLDPRVCLESDALEPPGENS